MNLMADNLIPLSAGRHPLSQIYTGTTKPIPVAVYDWSIGYR